MRSTSRPDFWLAHTRERPVDKVLALTAEDLAWNRQRSFSVGTGLHPVAEGKHTLIVLVSPPLSGGERKDDATAMVTVRKAMNFVDTKRISWLKKTADIIKQQQRPGSRVFFISGIAVPDAAEELTASNLWTGGMDSRTKVYRALDFSGVIERVDGDGNVTGEIDLSTPGDGLTGGSFVGPNQIITVDTVRMIPPGASIGMLVEGQKACDTGLHVVFYEGVQKD